MLFGPTAHHLSPPSRHGVRGHGGGSYIYDLLKRINKQHTVGGSFGLAARRPLRPGVVCGRGEYI